VWRQLALGFRLDTEHTVLTGYSMGGYASYLLGLTYPDLFAEAMPLAGPPSCGLYVIGPLGGSADGGTGSDPHCDNDGKTGPLVANATWVPSVMADGTLDELVPYSSVLEQISRFDAAGLRYHFLTYPTEDHLAFAAQDRFSAPISLLGTPARVTDPGTIHYSWYPDAVSPRLGIGASSVYWLSGLGARTTTGGTIASVTANDGARPMPRHTTTVTTTPVPRSLSYVDRTSSWVLGPTPAATRTLQLQLTDVSTLTVNTTRALLPHGTARVTSDGPATLTLSELRPGTTVRGPGGQTVVAGQDGTAAVTLPAGPSKVSW
jgi:pimeloyl-ACP methyl ester carboxylesterase